GLSTQPIWRKLWDDVMKTRPPNWENITCWRKKFLETFFSNVLHGVLDISSDWRLSDHHFSPLLHSSPHVSQLTLCNMLQGAVELTAEHNHKVLENLAGSLQILKFQHLLSSDQSTRCSLVLLLHRLIHHGSVSQVSMYTCPAPDTVLLVLILSMSAGFWRSGNALAYHRSPCGLCTEEDKAQSQEPAQQQAERGCYAERVGSDGENQKGSPRAPEEADTHLNPVLSSPRSPPHQTQECVEASSEVPCDYTSIQGGSSPHCSSEQLSCHSVPRKTRRRLKPAVGRKRRCLKRSRGPYADPEDLYDFVFTVAREDNSGLLDKNSTTEGENTENWTSSSPGSQCTGHAGCKKRVAAGIFSLKAAHRFRSVSTLELFSIPLTGETCRTLSNLLSSWVSLENLVLSYNGLDANIFCILSGLQALSRHPDCRLRVLRVSDVCSHMPCMELVRCILSAFPQLHTLSVSFDLKNHLEGNRPERNPCCSEVEIPGDSKTLPKPLDYSLGAIAACAQLTVLKASKSLQHLSLDSATLPCPQELGLLLEMLKECNPNLKKLSFHDMNLAEHQKEVLLLLQDPILQEITFSFCRLFESSTAEFLSEIINTVKRNSSLKSLKLPGNRLGNHRLVALADIFSEDSSSSLCQLDVSSNCIKPDGLLEFTKKLEGHIQQRGGQIQFTHLRLFQNWLDQDAETAQEALRRLKAVCTVVNDSWDSSQAFADYISVM
ncbi:Leucine-rich repeat-containing protein 41, partial [Acanthisitta chloris]